jgi:phosphoribosyl-AMP cyclohydrolase
VTLDADADLDFGADGLVPVVAQDADSGEVLMLAYATREAVARTRETGRAH